MILLASTNRPDILDPALLRPGRFDRQIVVDRPDLEGRRQILEVHARDKPIAPGVDLGVIARRTPGFTGADLANLINEAALLSRTARAHPDRPPSARGGVERVMAGPERKSRVISERERRVIAYHEGGHALVAHALPNADPVHKISIIPRGRALGYTLTLPTEDKFLVTRSELVDELAMLLGGRSAEELVFADPTTGAQNDIDRATTIARQMVTEFGMSEVLGPLRLGQPHGQVFLGRDFTSTPDYSEEIAARIDAEVRVLIEGAHQVAHEILAANRAVLDRLADELVAHETLDVDRVQEMFAGVEPFTGSGSGRGTAAAASDVADPRRGQVIANHPTTDGARGRLRPAGRACRSTSLASSGPSARSSSRSARTPTATVSCARRRASPTCTRRSSAASTTTRRRHLTVTFEADHDEMVMVRDIAARSASASTTSCPFAGRAHVAYIPGDDGRITGLSKLARLVDGFARRPQVQERLTTQVADALVGGAQAPGRLRDDRGRAPLHVDAGREEAGLPHRHLRGAGPVQDQPGHPRRGHEPHHPPRQPPLSRAPAVATGVARGRSDGTARRNGDRGARGDSDRPDLRMFSWARSAVPARR